MLGWALLRPGAGGWAGPQGPPQAPRASLGALSPPHPWASLWVPRSTARTATGGQPVPSPVCPQTRAWNDPMFSVGQALSTLNSRFQKPVPTGLCVYFQHHTAHLSSTHFMLLFVTKSVSLCLLLASELSEVQENPSSPSPWPKPRAVLGASEVFDASVEPTQTSLRL